jgi:hypothetical protein
LLLERGEALAEAGSLALELAPARLVRRHGLSVRALDAFEGRSPRFERGDCTAAALAQRAQFKFPA